MKFIHTLIFCTLLSFCFASKNDSTKVKKNNAHELSLNATFFIKQFVNFSSNNNIAISPYAMSYKLITPKNNALRFSIGLEYNGSKDPVDGTDDKTFVKQVDLNYRIGFEHRFDLGKKWMAFVGGDVTSNFTKNKTGSKTTIVNPNPPFDMIDLNIYNNEQTIGFGAGPVVGIQINFTPKISLFTESSFLFTQNFSKREIVSRPSIVSESKDRFSSNSMVFVLPTSLFFAFKF